MASRLETLLRAKWLSLWMGHCSRIEAAIGSDFGVPDTLLAFAKMIGLAEFKVLDEDGAVSFTKQQLPWIRRFSSHATQAALIIMNDQGFVVLSYQVAAAYAQPDRKLYLSTIPGAVKDFVKWRDAEAMGMRLLVRLLKRAWYG